MQSLAVVPIFMSAGAAVLPTILAAGASVAAIVFKPRELLRVSRQNPRGVALFLVLASLAVAATVWGVHAATHPKPVIARAGQKYDWAKVGADLLAQQEAGRKFTDLGAVASVQATTQKSDVPVVVTVKTPDTVPAGGGAGGAGMEHVEPTFARTHFDGGQSPTNLKPLWIYKPDGAMFLAKPAITKNAMGAPRIYAAGCLSDIGGYTGLLACLDADTGRPIWEVIAAQDDILKPFFSSPALSDDGKYLVIGQGLHEDRDCSLLCFETATGKLKWAVKTPLHIESSPAIFGDIAAVGAGAIEGTDGRAIGNPGFVFGVRISTGEKLWEQPVNDPESAPAIDAEGIVYIGSGFNGDAVVAMRSAPDAELKRQGVERLLWKTPMGLPVTGDITIAGDMVVAGAGNGDFVHSSTNAKGAVVALDRKTGALRWRTPVDDSVLGAIAYRDGTLLCPSRTGEVLALAADTGALLWKTRISGTAPILAGPAFTDQRVYAASSDGYLAVLDRVTGKLLEKIALNDQAKPGTGLTACPPQVANGRVIAGSETGGVVCFFGPAAGGGNEHR